MFITTCLRCGVQIKRAGQQRPGKYCSRVCAGRARRDEKPVSREWLEQKYLVERLGTVEIGRLVKRNPKRVYEWLIGYGIPLRPKWTGSQRKQGLHWSREWLEAEYVKGRTLAEMAKDAGVAEATVHDRMQRFGIARRTSADTLALNGHRRVLSGEEHPMFGRRGAAAPNWKGGCTPERQAFYSSPEWCEAVKAVWKRDNGCCQRCGMRKVQADQEFAIHHIVSFAVVALRATVSNLVLLCADCHLWVHSKANLDRDFLAEPVV